uniref:Uncharacterized protein n=1 Tax=Arundo donax TaxID=35708 RepID=A0A0A8ZZG0_ARUDO
MHGSVYEVSLHPPLTTLHFGNRHSSHCLRLESQ